MGNLRVPKTHYFKQGVVNFYVKNKQICYSVRLWTSDGRIDFEFERGYFIHTDTESIVKRALLAFSSVGVIEK